jgi:hypothetical protein
MVGADGSVLVLINQQDEEATYQVRKYLLE